MEARLFSFFQKKEEQIGRIPVSFKKDKLHSHVLVCALGGMVLRSGVGLSEACSFLDAVSFHLRCILASKDFKG
eukprot:4858494-Amphidinium_carterae.1